MDWRIARSGIGDRYRIGGAVFEVTQPRVTCWRLGIRMNHHQMPALVVAHRRPGFYFRVIQEGEVGAGDAIEKIADGPERMSVAEVDQLLYSALHPVGALQRAVRISALSPGPENQNKNGLTETDIFPSAVCSTLNSTSFCTTVSPTFTYNSPVQAAARAVLEFMTTVSSRK
jgi:MOSC domain-containing protein YiiM